MTASVQQPMLTTMVGPDDDPEKSTMKTNNMTTTSDVGHEGGFDEDRDDGADNPDVEILRTTVVVPTGGCGLPSGFVGNVRATTGSRSPSAPAKCRSSPSALPAWTPRAPSNGTLRVPISFAWLEVGVGTSVVLGPPFAYTGSLWCSSLRRRRSAPLVSVAGGAPHT
jgi:hypothetical protein